MRVLTIALFVGLSLFPGCSSEPAAQEVEAAAVAEPMAVRVAVTEMRHIEKAISVTGALMADEEVTLGPEADGRLATLHADFGQRVRAGAVIAELDKRELELQLERMRASLAQALAQVGLTPEQADVIPETTPQIRQAQAQLDDARVKFESASKLVKTGDISSERFTEMEKGYNARQAALDATRHGLRTSLASIQALRAEVKLAEKRLDDATVRAPFDGAVAERMASPGQYLQRNAPIVRLVKTYPLRLRADIPESAAGTVRVGTALTFVTDAIPGERFRAVVREVNPSLDARSRSLSAEARLPVRDARLRPGMFVQVQLVVDNDAEILVVPKEAVQTVAGLSKIFVIRDGRAVEQKIVRGAEVDGWIEIRDAQFEPGEPVAVDNLGALTDGAPVRSEI